VALVIGTLQARLLIRESRSLKDKRQVVRSILDKTRDGFNVAATEVDARDDVKLAVLGFAAIGSEVGVVRGVLQQITEALRRHPIAEYLGGEISVGD
jgi:hypothetical protein